jgi:transcriptional regulator with XRE-family HTH domain
MANDADGPRPSSLAARLDKLFRTVRRADGKEFSHREVAEGITAAGESISHTYVGHLRSGKQDNPTLKHLRALARFFGVPVEYFTNDRLAGQVGVELELAAALQDLQVKTVALRQTVATEASKSLASIARIMDTIRQLEADRTGATDNGD